MVGAASSHVLGSLTCNFLINIVGYVSQLFSTITDEKIICYVQYVLNIVKD